MQSQKVTYRDDNVTLEGHAFFDGDKHEKRPLVLVSHDWSGRNDFADSKAEQLAKLGYVGFALDMYGQGVTGKDTAEKMALMQPLVTDRKFLLRRILAGLNTASQLPMVDSNKIAAIGFCFGGLCVLDLARSGTDIRGVVSFHGLLNAPEGLPKNKIKAKVLAIHGHDDPMGKPDQVLAFEQEMTAAGADWQLHIYGNTMHAFTNPRANDVDLGLVYKPIAEKRSWQAMQNFLTEIFV